jgi:uncharacterized protein (UPF0335 family)
LRHRLAPTARRGYESVSRVRSPSKQERKTMPDVGGIAADQLRSFVERIERLEEEKKALADDIRDVYAQAKGSGFDLKVLRQVVRLRKMNSSDRQEQETLLDIYKRALGM